MIASETVSSAVYFDTLGNKTNLLICSAENRSVKCDECHYKALVLLVLVVRITQMCNNSNKSYGCADGHRVLFRFYAISLTLRRTDEQLASFKSHALSCYIFINSL